MRNFWFDFACWVIAIPLGALPVVRSFAAEPHDVDFRRDIRPILSDKCFQCHGPDGDRESELRLDLEQSVKELRDGVAAVVPHQVEQSLLYQRITTNDDSERMPPSESGKSLTPREIELLRTWIEEGAPWAGHWAFEEIVPPSVPRIDGDWARNAIDVFVQQRLTAAGVPPSSEVDRRTFIRRVSFDLSGLPPSPEEVEQFVNDSHPLAAERLVDRLLGSPAFGERWGRVWLDLARYTDTTAEWLNSTGQAWLYRDWVIRAVNDDMPYDRFVQLQLAADSLPDVEVEDLPALGFLGLSPTYWKELRLAPDV
ncbi:MAG: DUF1549 domain-containing protein, partial [Planctomycetaceae bacterium]|nr:DUF1549 domain-containing protein [Planctomycetaceae bacterium]